MISSRVGAALDDPRTVYLAMLASLLAGLFFTFVWAPHPWGWQGIDQYHELAIRLARGEPSGVARELAPDRYRSRSASPQWRCTHCDD